MKTLQHYTSFGLQGNVGEERLALFCKLIGIIEFVGVSKSSMGRMKNIMMQMLLTYQTKLQPQLDKLAAKLSIVAGADETFFDRLLILLFMDLSSGYICLEELATDRKATTWAAKTAVVRNKFKAILCIASDRAKSLIKFTKDAKIKSIADLYHMQQSVVRLFRYAFAAKRRSLKKQEKVARKELKRLMADTDRKTDLISTQQSTLQEIEQRNTLINKSQTAYRKQLHEISTATHPFYQHSEIKTSAELRKKLTLSLAILRNIAKECEIKDDKKFLNYFENNIAELSALIDLWWQWVNCDLESQGCSDELAQWLKSKLLPVLYWQEQIKKSRKSKALKEEYKGRYADSKKALEADPLTDKYNTQRWMFWARTWVLKFQRSTSQVEGHNARSSETHHCLRGLTALQIKADVVMHNCWITRQDGTTATERLFKSKPPYLFEWLVDHMPEVALPRKYKQKEVATGFALTPALAI